MELKIQLRDDKYKPSYSTSGSAGIDLKAVVEEGSINIEPFETVYFDTGIKVSIPEGFVGLIYARSGLSTKYGLAPANKVGVIDSDYRGPVKVALYNHSNYVREVSDGDRIAQLIITPYITADIKIVDTLDETERGSGGFGSTGK